MATTKNQTKECENILLAVTPPKNGLSLAYNRLEAKLVNRCVGQQNWSLKQATAAESAMVAPQLASSQPSHFSTSMAMNPVKADDLLYTRTSSWSQSMPGNDQTILLHMLPTPYPAKFRGAAGNAPSERVVIFHIDLKHSAQDARIMQPLGLVIAYDPSTKEEYCGEFNECVQPPKKAKWEKGAMEVHGIWPNQEGIKNAGSTVGVWP